MKSIEMRAVGAMVLASAMLATAPASAEWEVYNRDGAKLVINADIIGAGFANADSWFGEDEEFLGDDTDNWLEFGFEPKLSGEMPLGGGTAYGQVSGVYTATIGEDASGLSIGTDAHELLIEQGHIGWKKDDLFAGLEEDTFSIAIGRQDYSIGTGMIINDGGSDGGDRGGWYLGMRKAFQESIIMRIKSKTLLAEGFRVRNRPRRGGTQGEAYGGNLEYTFAGQVTVGGTYMIVDAEIPASDELDVFSGRLDWKFGNGFSIGGEYVHEDSDEIEADGWYVKAAYETPDLPWKPVWSYRYAHFDGDDPGTADDERFRELAYGYTDYGSWFQGEITGNYPLANGNLQSHQVRVKATPLESLTLNFLYYHFTLDEPASFGVTSDNWGDEINLIADWAATEKLYIIGVVGVLFPGNAAEQFVGGGDDDWLYSMLYGSYSW
jgi:hypothetical protein